MDKVLFITYGGGHVEIIRRIVNTLPIADDCKHVLALTSAYYVLENKKNVYGIGDVFKALPKKEKTLVLEIIDFIHSNNLELGVRKDKESLLYYSIGALDFVVTHGLKSLKSFHWDRNKFLQLTAIQAFIENLKDIKLIVTTTSPRFERAGLMIGQNLGIETIQIDDLFVNYETQFYGKHNIVASEIEKQILFQRNPNIENIYALGNPVLEDYLNTLRYRTVKGKYIYFCPHKDVTYNSKGEPISYGPDHQNHVAEFTALKQLLSNNPNLALIVRPHPNDDSEEYIKYKSIVDFEIKCPKHESLMEAINKCLVWITPASTTGIQASIGGKAVVTYKFRESDSHPVWRMTKPPFMYYSSLNDLSANLKYLNLEKLQKSSQKEWDFLYGSTKRISQLIISKLFS